MTTDMNGFYIDRRKLLKLGLSATALTALPFSQIALAKADSNELLGFVSDSDMPVDSTVTGTLKASEFKALSGLSQYVDQAWELDGDMAAYLSMLQFDLGLKSQQQPSYLTEYQHAVELVDVVHNNAETTEQAWTLLLFADFDVKNFEFTKLGRARRFVFSELIAHQIPISGAFKSFGLVNYRGYFGGPYRMPSSYKRGRA